MYVLFLSKYGRKYFSVVVLMFGIYACFSYWFHCLINFDVFFLSLKNVVTTFHDFIHLIHRSLILVFKTNVFKSFIALSRFWVKLTMFPFGAC